jgi:sugar (pentulose or hexulose) kinase
LRQGCVIVLDVGKSLAKLTLWGPDRRLIDRRTRVNAPVRGGSYLSLDVAEITAWLETGLQAFARQGDIAAIVPVGHGAAACILDADGLCIAPMDYEAEPPAQIAARYRALRDPFAATGSPALPVGLNLGLQLYWLETLAPDAMRRGRIVPWPQYWAWLLSGVSASEVTSLGCHSDLWLPREGRPSAMAVTRGWAQRLAPLRNAGDILGPVREEWHRRCSLPQDCMVLCGLHDSNAALLAARLYPEIGARDSTLLSTGTWFVALRSGAQNIDLALLPESRDCLVNVDIFGVPVPAARFMGGREAEILEEAANAPIDPVYKSEALLQRAGELIAAGAMALPAVRPGTGPFGKNTSRRIVWPEDQIGRRALAGLYLAMMADTTLNLIGARERLVIEGRFAADPVFTGALASLRSDLAVFLSPEQNNLPFGALSLVDAALPPQAALTRAGPLTADLHDYARQWRGFVQADKT